MKEPLLDSGPLVSDTTAGWHHRGSTIHRDVNPRHARKASLPFRGKGFKVERRKRRRK